MSGILPTSIGYISPHGDFSRHNTQALSGVSHLWQDFFAQALAEQTSEVVPACGTFPPVDLNSPEEPTVGSELHAHIVSQRECDVVETEVRPPEPLFLPIAEFEMELLDKPFAARGARADDALRHFYAAHAAARRTGSNAGSR